MIALDTNILVYSVREDSPWHEQRFPASAASRKEALCGRLPGRAFTNFWRFSLIPRFISRPRLYKTPFSRLTSGWKAPACVSSASRRIIGITSSPRCCAKKSRARWYMTHAWQPSAGHRECGKFGLRIATTRGSRASRPANPARPQPLKNILENTTELQSKCPGSSRRPYFNPSD